MSIKKIKIVKKEQDTDVKVKTFSKTGDYAFIPEKLKKFCVPMFSIKLDPSNPRKNDEAAKEVAKLIQKNGFRKPIVVDQNRIIRAGNTVYKSARILGMKFIPIAESDFEETEAITYEISDNKANDYSDWDDDILRVLIKNYSLDSKENASASGLTDKCLNKLLIIKKEQQAKHIMELAVTCENEEMVQTLFNELTNRGYVCRVISL